MTGSRHRLHAALHAAERAPHDDALGHPLEQQVDRDRRAGNDLGRHARQTVELDRRDDRPRVAGMAERGCERDAQRGGGGRHDRSLGAPGGPEAGQCWGLHGSLAGP